MAERFESVAAALVHRAAACGERQFVKAGGDWLTYAEMDRRSAALATGLSARGIGHGDRIGVIAPTRDEVLVTFFACTRIGAVFVPFNIYLKGEFLRHQLHDSRVVALVVDPAGAAAVVELIAGSSVKEVVLLDDPAPALTVPTIRWNDVAASREPMVDVGGAELRRSDPISIMYTSGTSGRSKGCLLSHGYFLSAALPYLDYGWLVPGDRIVTALPLFHLSAQNVLMQALVVDDVSACFEPVFSASGFLDRCRAEAATLTWGMGPMGMMILGQPEQDTDAAHPMRLSVWMAMHPDAEEAYEKRFGTPVIGEGYGQTECSPISLLPVGADTGRGTLGRPCPEMEVRLVDDEDEEVPDGEIGEIIIRPRHSNTVYTCYADNPEATVETWRNLWHHTGDYAYRDGNGWLVYSDRKKDALRRRGENVSSWELERAIVAHDNRIRLAAVTAVPSPLGEDDIKATLVLRDGAEKPSAEELFTSLSSAMPYFAIPRYLEFRTELPTTPTGRIQKHILRSEGVTPSTMDFEALGLTVAREQRRTTSPGDHDTTWE